MLRATQTDNTPLQISLQRHKSIFWLINMQMPSITNQLIILAFFPLGFQVLGLSYTVVLIPSLKIYLLIFAPQYMPLKCKNT
jgi:hypothetical protein